MLYDPIESPTRVSTNYLHMVVLIGAGNLTKGEKKNF